jgi:anti-sigma B factor antagonist
MLQTLATAVKMCQYFDLVAMDIQVESRENRRIVRVRGKITFEHCPAFQNNLNTLLNENVQEIVIDFKDVPFIDSSGIGEVLRLFKLMKDRGGEVVLINPNRKLGNLFSMYRFSAFMKIREIVAPGDE